jgi:C-terminal processing protease CtpA/Prc
VAGARTAPELRRILSLMVGELNASHLGVNGPATAGPSTGRLGVRFDRIASERDGTLRVAEVLPLGPAALAGVRVGDAIASIDGRPVTRATNLDEALAFKIGRRVALGLTGDGGARREVAVRPVNLNTEKGLLYRAWVESRRAYVAKASGGKLGYVHMIDMSEASLTQLYQDLDAENQSKQGVVVDVRNNSGGFVNAYALDVFGRRPYLTMQTRGSVATPARPALGQRALELPTVLVTNQHSLSDAEDFTEGWRTLGLGPVVGEPTAGWIIFTWNQTLMDGTVLRLPRSRITDHAGKDMELHPRPVDVPVTRPVGEWYSGKDAQLDAAVTTLLKRVP